MTPVKGHQIEQCLDQILPWHPTSFIPSAVAMLGRHLLPADFPILTAYHFPLAQCVVISSYESLVSAGIFRFLHPGIKNKERDVCIVVVSDSDQEKVHCQREKWGQRSEEG